MQSFNLYTYLYPNLYPSPLGLELSSFSFDFQRHDLWCESRDPEKWGRKRDESPVQIVNLLFSHPGHPPPLDMAPPCLARLPSFKDGILYMRIAPDSSSPCHLCLCVFYCQLISDLATVRIIKHLIALSLSCQHLILVYLESSLNHSLGIHISDILSPPWFPQELHTNSGKR